MYKWILFSLKKKIQIPKQRLKVIGPLNKLTMLQLGQVGRFNLQGNFLHHRSICKLILHICSTITTIIILVHYAYVALFLRQLYPYLNGCARVVDPIVLYGSPKLWYILINEVITNAQIY